MSSSTERKANALFDEFMAAYLSGNRYESSDYLKRCPEPERERIQEAIEGFLFAYDNLHECDPKEKSVRSVMEYLAQVRHRKRCLSEARVRASEESWDQVVTQPLLRLRGLLYPHPEASRASIAVMNRQVPSATVYKGSFLTNLEKRSSESLAKWQAEKLLQRVGITEPPVSLEAIAEQLSLLVREVLMDGVEGCLVTDGDSGGIFINALIQDRRRRRYTFAHEIGHFILHRRIQTMFSDKEGELLSSGSSQEFEANAFASFLLMPSDLLPRDFGRAVPEFEMAQSVAEVFDASLLAVLRRLVRASNYRTLLVCTENGQIRWSDSSSEVEGFNKIVRRTSVGSAAYDLIREGRPGTRVREVSAHIWFEQGNLLRESVTLREESRLFDTGYVYTLLNVIEAV